MDFKVCSSSISVVSLIFTALSYRAQSLLPRKFHRLQN